VRGGYECGCLFVSCQDKLDFRCTEGLDDVEVFLARNAENAVHTLVLERRDQEIRTFGHVRYPSLCMRSYRSRLRN
jgi:hypothetical protein